MAHAARRRLARVGLWLTGAAVLGGTVLGAPVHAKLLRLERQSNKVLVLDLAESSRDAPTAVIPLHGPWRVVQTAAGTRTWETRNPIRPRTLFFHRAPRGMKLSRIRENGRAKRLSVAAEWSDATRTDTWTFSQDGVKVRRVLGDGPPADGEYVLRYARAVERERGLNRSMAGLPDQKSFAFRSLQVGDTSRQGLLLPAPSHIAFELTVPEQAVLRFEARILPSEAALPGAGSDGAEVVVSVGEEEVARVRVSERERTYRVDLSRWSGSSVQLHLRTAPGGTSLLDYVFIAEPTLYTPQPDPPRVVVVFIDTLRPDHMSLYGYERPTSPRLDAWAENAAIFSQARTIAPWTLPSARTILSGTHPERWEKVPHLQDRFADAGWATAFIAGNVYLSSNFQMAKGWGLHRCINWPQASVQVDRALDYLADRADQPVFMLLHLMDMHLPYTEPITHRYLFAGETPQRIGSETFLRKAVVRGAKTEDERQYVRDRYDNNMRYVDDHLARVLDTLGPQDTVVILSDHGEEFWEHGGFEHGHTLYDELLRVPLVVKGPGMTAGRFDAPVSLLDVAPTLAEMAGLGTEGMVGWDLRSLSNQTQSADFSARPHAFGRPLYGLRQWGSLKQGLKYTVHQGREQVFDLGADPGETTDLSGQTDTTPLQLAMGEALDRPVMPAWRVVPSANKNGPAVRVTLHVPGEVRAAWAGQDPTHSGRATVKVESNRVVARWPRQRGRVEAFIVPGPLDPDAAPITVDLKVGGKNATATLDLSATGKNGLPATYLRERLGGRTVEITSTIVPIPTDADGAIDGFDAEVAGDLEALGYVGD